jgi:hypothetical protein
MVERVLYRLSPVSRSHTVAVAAAALPARELLVPAELAVVVTEVLILRMVQNARQQVAVGAEPVVAMSPTVPAGPVLLSSGIQPRLNKGMAVHIIP